MSTTTQAFKPTGCFNTFRLTEHQAERTHAKIDRCCSFYYITCGSVYNVAQSAMVDAAAELRERPDIFRHRLKYNVRRALAAYDVWNRKMECQLADRYQLWLDISDKVDEEMQPHITKLYWAIKAVLMKRNIPDYALHRNPDQWKHLDKVDRMRLKKGLSLVDEEGNALNPCI